MGKSEKSWEKRLSKKTDDLAVDFVESLSYDRRLYKYDIAGSIAHSKMLAEWGLISKAECEEIKKGLLEIAGEIESGKFKFDKTLEDIHMAVEDALIKKVGEAGKKLHTARSRNDQVATDVRLWVRDEAGNLQSKLKMLQKALLRIAKEYSKNLMPSYTHMQRAQPIVIGAYLLSFIEQLERDIVRLGNCMALLNISPLGSGAIAGTTLPIDRDLTAKELGFCGVSRNSIDAVSDRDFCAEFIFDCSMIMMHLSRLAEDWIIYSSNEFGFVKIDDSYCTSSSMMPQKRNPDMLELMRGKTGGVYGNLMAMLVILKGQPSGYNRDLQEDKVQLFAASDTTSQCIEMAAAIVSNTKYDVKKIEAGIDNGFLDATALAEYLVGKGVAFRQAHGIVGKIVADCEKQGIKLSDIGLDKFKQDCNVIEKDVYEWLGAKNVVNKYLSEGSAGVNQVEKQIRYWQKQLGD